MWPVGQEVKTTPFHGVIMGSIPVRVTSSLARKQRSYVVCEFSFCLKIGLGTYMGLILSSCNFPYHLRDADFLYRDSLSP